MVFIPISVYKKAMDFTKEENVEVILSHVLFGLNKEGLIDYFRYAISIDEHLPLTEPIDEPGIYIEPSLLGVELFFGVFGKGNLSLDEFLDTSNCFPPLADVLIPEGSFRAKSLSLKTKMDI